MTQRIKRITSDEQYKDNLRDRLRKEAGIDDMEFGAVYSPRFNTSKGYYILHLIRKLPNSAIEYLYDKALTDMEGGGGTPELYVTELRYRAERRIARLALGIAAFAVVTASVMPIVLPWFAERLGG